MEMRRDAKITVKLNRGQYEASKYFFGTHSEVNAEAYDWMNIIILQYISKNNIQNQENQNWLIETSYFEIDWSDSNFLSLYAVNNGSEVVAACASLTDAEELIFSFGEDEENPYEATKNYRIVEIPTFFDQEVLG